MTVFEGLMQGIIQGLTEFLPISSDGHLALFQHFFGLSGENALFFTVMLHAGTLTAVFLAFRKRIFALIRDFFPMAGSMIKGKFSYKEAGENEKFILMVIATGIPLLLLFLVKDFFTSLAEDNDIIVEGFCFIYTGLLLFFADRCVKGKKTAKDMKLKDSLALGFFEGLAALPGVSRSGSTISVGLLKGFSKEFVVDFSFIMSIPAVLAACLFELLDAISEGIVIDPAPMIAGLVASFVVGLLAIRLVKWLVKTDRYVVFAYYTMALGVICAVIGAFELFI